MLPKIGPFAQMHQASNKVDEKQLSRVEAIINSMTAYEREHHEAINGSRRKRIARGSGTTRARGEQPAAPVRANAQDVQIHVQAKLRQTAVWNEDARDVSGEISRFQKANA